MTTPRLTYESPLSSPERILGFGPEGTGKSTMACTLMDRLPDAHFHVMDIDYSANYERLIESAFPRVAERGNYTIHELDPEDWEGIVSAMNEVVPMVEANDWWVVDSATHLWSAVQTWYTEQIYGKDLSTYFLDLQIAQQKARERAGNTRGSRGSSDEDDADDDKFDWKTVNAQYGHWRRIYKQCKGHILFTAEAKELPRKARGKDQIRDQERYGFIGYKPAGQKQLGYMPHTVLFMNKLRDTYEMTTVKDRGRADVANKEVREPSAGGFMIDYMVEVAGWKVKVLR